MICNLNYIMIPKVIYMCHKSLDKIKIYSENWKKLNPEYEIKLYDDRLCREFLLKEYSQLHLDVFNFIKDGPIKADFWRCCIINKFGGLYVDADIEPLVPLRYYIKEDDYFVTCLSQKKCTTQVNPHFLMCDKNNKLLQLCIRIYLQYYIRKKPYDYWSWSICKIMYFNFIKDRQSGIYMLGNKKFKFLYERNINDCEFRGLLVLHNRYKTYKNHQFIN